jgi:hypothetical protein
MSATPRRSAESRKTPTGSPGELLNACAEVERLTAERDEAVALVAYLWECWSREWGIAYTKQAEIAAFVERHSSSPSRVAGRPR